MRNTFGVIPRFLSALRKSPTLIDPDPQSINPRLDPAELRTVEISSGIERRLREREGLTDAEA